MLVPRLQLSVLYVSVQPLGSSVKTNESLLVVFNPAFLCSLPGLCFRAWVRKSCECDVTHLTPTLPVLIGSHF